MTKRAYGRRLLVIAAAIMAGGALALPAQAFEPRRDPSGTQPPVSVNLADRLPQDELVYFVLPDRFANGDLRNDRGGLKGDRLVTGFDPTDTGFYHGGDLKGLTDRLGYIQGLGATAIWLGPIYKNKPVQGQKGQESAGYHGYWITDFTQVDPHFGTRADLKALVDAAHGRGMKVYLDIVTNHTADVISYQECPTSSCAYRDHGTYPPSRRGGVAGEAINPGFLDDAPRDQTSENFARLTRPDYAYTPVVQSQDQHIKVPDWLNNPIYYHNRGDTTFRGESSDQGDFSGLDDLFTEHPRVVQGFIDVYGQWIDDFGIDGFRIDTAKHVNPQFWQAFIPAMLKRAEVKGIRHFHIFGEVADPAVETLARYTRQAAFPAVLDFAFQSVVTDTVAQAGSPERLARLFEADSLYADGAAARLPTFLGNHDNGRFGYFVRRANPKASDDEVLKRVLLGHAMLMTLRGQPVIYAGDEQGFSGSGDDKKARQSLFASKVIAYNAETLIGTDAKTTKDNYDQSHPIYRAIANLAWIRQSQLALRQGDQVTRAYDQAPGLFVVSRHSPPSSASDGDEVLIAFNTSLLPLERSVRVDVKDGVWTSLHGQCPTRTAAPGSYSIRLEPLDFIVCLRSAQP